MKILLAEDSKAIGLHISRTLEDWGHTVTFVLDGRAAVDAYQRERPDLILLDVVMPEMDGIEATRQIKALGGDRWVPLLLITALSTTEEVVTGLHAGADDYLTKPINFAVLQARINVMQRIKLIQDSLFGVLDNVFEGIIAINERGLIKTFNQAAEKIFGYRPAEVIGQNVKMLMPQPYRDEHDGYLARYQAEQTSHIIGIGRKVKGRRRNGDVFPMHLSVTEIERDHGSLFIGLVRDISAEEAAREKIEFLAMHDALTGLPNRARLGELLDQRLCSATPPCDAILFIDLDGFKPINDKHGHEIGDQALIEVARRLLAGLDSEAFVGRLGGDEFVVVLLDVSGPQAAIDAGHAIIAALQPAMQLGPEAVTCRLGASIGVALGGMHGNTRTVLLTAADSAMYMAKRAGKGRVVLAPPEA